MEKHPLHIKSPELQTSEKVKEAVKRKERRSREKVSNDPSSRIGVYIERLENIFLNPDETVKKRNVEMFRSKIHDSLIIDRDNFPDSYFELQKRIARERGQAIEEIPEYVQEQMKDVAIEDQRRSLDAWIDYLTSNNAVYPAWFKYYVWNQVTKLSQFDKEKGEFKKRTSTTVSPFPDIYREPLAQIFDIYEKFKEDNKNLKELEIREAFSKKFSTLYAELIQKFLEASIGERGEIKGKWIKYEKGHSEDAIKLFESLKGRGTGWCTAGKSTAETQIESGDFYVYYTYQSDQLDEEGNPRDGEKPKQPRLAIRMEGNDRIGEVRGILPDQGVEPVMQEVLDEKLNDFGDEADSYKKKSENMKMLTSIERKQENNEPLSKKDLIFLYEIDSTIEGFGYHADPRIAELRQRRNLIEDLYCIFDVSSINDLINILLDRNHLEKLKSLLNFVVFNDNRSKINTETFIKLIDFGFIYKISLLSSSENKLNKEVLKYVAKKYDIKDLYNFNLLKPELYEEVDIEIISLIAKIGDSDKLRSFFHIYKGDFMDVANVIMSSDPNYGSVLLLETIDCFPGELRNELINSALLNTSPEILFYSTKFHNEYLTRSQRDYINKKILDFINSNSFEGDWHIVIGNLLDSGLKGISNKIAMKLIEHGFAEDVFEHRDIFEHFDKQTRDQLKHRR